MTGSSPTAPSHSTDTAEGRGIVPNKTGMKKSAECWAVSREVCTADSPSCHHPGQLKSPITGEKLPFPAPHCLTQPTEQSPGHRQKQSLTSPPVSAHSPSTKPSAGQGQLLPKRAGREWKTHGSMWGVLGCAQRQGWQAALASTPTSLPAVNSGIVPNTAHRQGTPVSTSPIPVCAQSLRNTGCPEGWQSLT